MTGDPVILILEDERAQILTLRAQLAGLGKLVEFMDPEQALAYLRDHPCDAAIVDVGMPRSSMDGLAFLRALRQFDRDLAVIIRTGSDSDQIADGAIELRAIKRAVKSKTTLKELRASTSEAIRETRERREINRQAREGGATETKLLDALGAYDLRLAAADLQRGLVHALRNRLTALSAMASVLRADAAASGVVAFGEHARRSEELVGDMVDSLNAFLDGPFGDGGDVPGAGVNVCLGALRQFFIGADRWVAEEKRLVIRDLLSDTRVDCAPLELMNGLRHLAEYFFVRAARGAEIALTAGIVHSSAQMTEKLTSAACVLNREAIQPARPYVGFRVSAVLPEVAPETVRDAFALGPDSGRTGNLHVLSQVLAAVKGAVLLHRTAAGLLVAEALVPVSL